MPRYVNYYPPNGTSLEPQINSGALKTSVLVSCFEGIPCAAAFGEFRTPDCVQNEALDNIQRRDAFRRLWNVIERLLTQKEIEDCGADFDILFELCGKESIIWEFAKDRLGRAVKRSIPNVELADVRSNANRLKPRVLINPTPERKLAAVADNMKKLWPKIVGTSLDQDVAPRLLKQKEGVYEMKLPPKNLFHFSFRETRQETKIKKKGYQRIMKIDNKKGKAVCNESGYESNHHDVAYARNGTLRWVPSAATRFQLRKMVDPEMFNLGTFPTLSLGSHESRGKTQLKPQDKPSEGAIAIPIESALAMPGERALAIPGGRAVAIPGGRALVKPAEEETMKITGYLAWVDSALVETSGKSPDQKLAAEAKISWSRLCAWGTLLECVQGLQWAEIGSYTLKLKSCDHCVRINVVDAKVVSMEAEGSKKRNIVKIDCHQCNVKNFKFQVSAEEAEAFKNTLFAIYRKNALGEKISIAVYSDAQKKTKLYHGDDDEEKLREVHNRFMSSVYDSSEEPPTNCWSC